MNPFTSIEGWIELGNFTEAAEELNNLPPSLKSSVEFVRLWVQIYTASKAWPNVEAMAETLLKHAPGDPFALHSYAEALHKQGRTQEAFSTFQFAPTEFKQGGEYFYRLARFLCALDQCPLALSCLGNAFDADPDLRLLALNDPELERVWLDLHDG